MQTDKKVAVRLRLSPPTIQYAIELAKCIPGCGVGAAVSVDESMESHCPLNDVITKLFMFCIHYTPITHVDESALSKNIIKDRKHGRCK